MLAYPSVKVLRNNCLESSEGNVGCRNKRFLLFNVIRIRNKTSTETQDHGLTMETGVSVYRV